MSTSYSVSKAALNQFTKCCALDLAPKGIRVNAVCPAVVKTPIYDALGLPKEQLEAQLDEYAKLLHPIERCGEIKEIATAIAYLASDDASFVTGTLFKVDGGCSI